MQLLFVLGKETGKVVKERWKALQERRKLVDGDILCSKNKKIEAIKGT